MLSSALSLWWAHSVPEVELNLFIWRIHAIDKVTRIIKNKSDKEHSPPALCPSDYLSAE